MDAMKAERRKIMGKHLLLAVLTVVCFAAGALAQPCLNTDPTCTLELMAPPPGPSMAGYYIDPYTALVGAAGQTERPLTEFRLRLSATILSHHQYEYSPWQANQISLGTFSTPIVMGDRVPRR